MINTHPDDWQTNADILAAAGEWIDADFKEAFLSNVKKALASGALGEGDRNWLMLRAVLLITAESYVRSNMPEQQKLLDNLRCFI